MLIYFNASVSSRSEFKDEYQEIVNVLESLGHRVLSDHILEYPESGRKTETEESRKAYYSKMIRKIKRADLMVAEVSFPSTIHVGHELTLALDANKPVLALHKKNMRPILFWGLHEEKFLVEEYSLVDLKQLISKSIEYLTEQMDTRFNFFISPKIGNYLDWIAKKKKTPRAVYLRKLIEKEMENSKEYNKN